MSTGKTRLEPGLFLAAATIFAGALLLFEVEPLIAKAILPWFGGSAQVWTTCLLFFQTALLAGYLYAHILTSHVSPRWQWRIHVGLLIACSAFLPIIPADYWKPLGGEDPLWLILGLLTTTIGLPFVLLASTSPLVQAWLARPVNGEVRIPYRLFALSNFGSLLALLAYPIVVEPYLAVRSQAWLWSILFAGFVPLCAATAYRFRTGEPRLREIAGRLPLARYALWFCLAAAPSGLLLAMTNYMLQNVAPIPLFWIVPLALYLLSFVVAFNSPRWFAVPHWYVTFVMVMAVVILTICGFLTVSNLVLLPLLSASLYVLCYVCHGELAHAKPEPQYLTGYYLTISTGGAAGGLFVAVIAPTVFNASYDLAILLPFSALVVVLAAARHHREWSETRPAILAFGGFMLVATTGLVMARYAYELSTRAVLLERNFYGALRVTDVVLDTAERPPARDLANGNILHGVELRTPADWRIPLSYYAPASGVGRAITELAKDGPLRVGVIGLGVGTMAGYGRPGDVYRFYEINPAVLKIAREQFHYLGTNPARQSIVLGDARLSLEREPPQKFDLLVVDAFTSDSIPMHLLTKEALALYWRHLKPNGVLAVHVSNRFVSLAPVVAQPAQADGRTARLVDIDTNWDIGATRSVWVLVTRRTELFHRPLLQYATPIPIPYGLQAWTDDHSSIWSVLRL
jgi:SAM-dependent methyltransferase